MLAHRMRPTTPLWFVVSVVALLASALALSMAVNPPEASPAARLAAAATESTSAPSASALARTGETPAAAVVTTAPTMQPAAGIAIVPIVGFWSSDRALSLDRVRTALAGRDTRYRRVVVADPDLAALAAGLGVTPGPKVEHLAPKAVLAAVLGRTDVLGFIRAADIRPSVRALGVGGRTLFGDTRVRSVAEWPLTVPGPRGAPVFDPAATWTLVAAGDVMNDREVYRRTVLLGKGPDFPWNGGTARIVRRSCCSVGLTTVTAVRTGHAGAVAALFRGADLALVNHEGPAPVHFSYHPTGLTFTFDPRLEVGIRHAGVDIVSLANNHTRNAGSTGVLQTISAVTKAGLVPIGAGRNTAAARRPAWLTADGVRVAILAYDAINLSAAGATSARPGAAPLQLPLCRADIAAARKAGADVVIVVPHWGVEYTSQPTPLQRSQAAALIAAGADVVLGSHPHWAGAMEAIGKGVVIYSMGDFIFDLARSEQTDEGLIVELTFVGKRLAQIDIHPTIELDRSQPNLLDPADGRVILGRIRAAAAGFLRW